ncbi:MAG TPA: pantetheine-phosphate adenylyltransferase [Thermoplasmata archaeon]|nr:pantetheine-phosphate adenylyltransferase [Thermoplasmata archaeon]
MSRTRAPAKFRMAAVGGTFDRLHRGHRALLLAAFGAAGRVGIGLTTDEFLRTHPKPGARRIRPFDVRRAELLRYLRRHFRGRDYRIVPLRDPLGGAVDREVEVLVVSEETASGARAVNRERRRRRIPPVAIRTIPMVRGDDHRPIAGRRLRDGTIDPEGHRRAPLSIAVALSDASRLRPLRRAIAHEFAPAPIRWRGTRALRRRAGEKGAVTARRAARVQARRAEIGIAFVTGRDGRTALAVHDPEGPAGVAIGPSSTVRTLSRLVHRAITGPR